MGEKQLVVNMLGGFSVEYGGEPVKITGNYYSRTVQLLLILWDAGERGIGKTELLDILYGNSEINDLSNSMRVTVFRLRKMLKEWKFPEHEYIRIAGGVYRWDCGELKTSLDTVQFSEAVREAEKQPEGEKQLELLEKACAIYKGEFLPGILGEVWVECRTADYQKTYVKTVTKLHGQLMKNKEYKRALETMERAAAIFPCEEFTLMQIDTLIAQNNLQRAIEILDQMSKILFEEMGVSPTEELLSRYRKLGGYADSPQSTLKVIKKRLKGENEKKAVSEQGAYYCSFPGFTDCYRLLRRISERSGQPMLLLACVLTDGKGRQLEAGDKGFESAQQVMDAVKISLRSGDVYTRYGDNYFLILLTGASVESSALIMKRIETHFKQMQPMRGVHLDFYVTSIAEAEKNKK